MKIPGKIKNVVDFGAFVDLGIKESALVHISELSDHFVKDPLEVVKVGDVLEFTIISLDTDRRRIGLSRKTNPGQGGEFRSESSGAVQGAASAPAAARPAQPGRKPALVVKRAEKADAPARPEHPARPAAENNAAKGGRPERPGTGTNRPGGPGGFSPRGSGSDDGTMYNPFAEALRKMRDGKRDKKNNNH
jgi:uncharacterized protein